MPLASADQRAPLDELVRFELAKNAVQRVVNSTGDHSFVNIVLSGNEVGVLRVV